MEFKFPKGAPGTVPQSRAVTGAIKVLSRQRNGTLLTTRDLCARIGLVSFGNYGTHPALANYRAIAPRGHDVYWGNEATIKAFNKEFSKI